MVVTTSPFRYQGPLEAADVTGRDELIAELLVRIRSRRLTALLGPRRYGKTSLLRRVAEDLRGSGTETIWVDLYGCSSMADLAAALDRGLASTRGRVRRSLESIAGTFSLDLGVLGVELTKGRRDRPDPAMLTRSLMQILVRTAQRQDVLLVLDEFSSIATIEHAAAILRTELQHHYQELGIVFAGSQPSTMRALFTDRAQPFFAQADLLEIGPLSREAVREVVERGFASTGRDVGPVLSHLVAMAAGHPQRAMQLADALWWATEPDGTADEVAWEAALASVRSSVDAGSDRLFDLLPIGHQKALRVVASGGSVYGAAAEVLDLPGGTARGAVKALLGSGYLVQDHDAGRLQIVDPMLADWIRRRFPV